MGRGWPWVGGAAVFVVVLLAGWWLIDLQVARAGLEPAGDTCTWQDDPGSGPSGSGLERTQWHAGIWPEIVCSGSDGEAHAGEHLDHTSGLRPNLLDQEDFVPWAGAYGGSLLTAAAAGGVTVVLLRRRSRRTRSADLPVATGT